MQTAEAILLRRIRFGDSSLIVSWLTREHGKIKTIAKGATRPKSSFSGRLDLFFTAEILYQESRRSEISTLREVHLLKTREGVRKGYANVQLGAYFVELLELALEPAAPVPEIFDLLTRGLDHLATTPGTRRALFHFERELARFLGVWEEGIEDTGAALGRSLGRVPATRSEVLQLLD